MRVGILTFHKAHNYGAVLQAYGLQTMIESLGHKVEFVDYSIPSMLEMYNWKQGIRSIVNRYFFTKGIVKFVKLLMKKKRYNRFQHFIKQHLKESNNGTDKLDDEFDVIIVGSDQVFNANITGGVNNAYWGVLPSFSKRLITYAASTRPYTPTEEQSANIKHHLKRFSALSVREPYTADFLRPYTNENIKIVLDPTLLLSQEQWELIVAKPQLSQPYMFYYYIDSNDCDLDYANFIAKEKGLKLVVIGCYNKLYSSTISFSAGPSEFLSWIKHAEYVLTSSFHCTVFSIIFNKQFNVLPIRGKKDYRVSSLLSTFDLSDRMIVDGKCSNNEIEKWCSINEKLATIKKESIAYLTANII